MSTAQAKTQNEKKREEVGPLVVLTTATLGQVIIGKDAADK